MAKLATTSIRVTNTKLTLGSSVISATASLMPDTVDSDEKERTMVRTRISWHCICIISQVPHDLAAVHKVL